MFLTPNEAGGGNRYLLFKVPEVGGFSSLLLGAITPLAQELNYTKHGQLEPFEAAQIFAKVLQDMRYYIPPEIGDIVDSIADKDPAYFLLLDGSTHNADDWPELFALLPATWKNTTTFTLPNMAGLTRVGAGTNGARTFTTGGEGGEFEHTLTIDEIPAHNHTYVPPTLNVDMETPGVPDIQAAGIGLPANTGDAGGGEAHNNMQPYLVVKSYIVGKLP